MAHEAATARLLSRECCESLFARKNSLQFMKHFTYLFYHLIFEWEGESQIIVPIPPQLTLIALQDSKPRVTLLNLNF